jgi:hypothetical protein
MRATYRRLQGTEQFLGFYDVHADCLSGLFRRRCSFRRCYPRKRLFVILDNLHNQDLTSNQVGESNNPLIDIFGDGVT